MYKLIRDDDGLRVESDGDVIWGPQTGYTYPSPEIAEAILNDANMSNPQREAIKAALGLVEITDETNPR